MAFSIIFPLGFSHFFSQLFLIELILNDILMKCREYCAADHFDGFYIYIANVERFTSSSSCT